jgi:hypothetical protein
MHGSCPDLSLRIPAFFLWSNAFKNIPANIKETSPLIDFEIFKSWRLQHNFHSLINIAHFINSTYELGWSSNGKLHVEQWNIKALHYKWRLVRL